MRILIVEDDVVLGETLQGGLRQEGNVVDWLRDGESARYILKNQQFDAIILDLGLPKLNGLYLLRELRSRDDKTPVLVLTAKDTVFDKIQGLDSGADDYMSKPFDLYEVGARLRALQRRSMDRAVTLISHGDLKLDPSSHEVYLAGELVSLTRREFSLLQKLLENLGKVLSREQLVNALYTWSDDVDSNVLEVHIHNLRKKFGSNLIKTIRGVGYIIEKIK